MLLMRAPSSAGRTAEPDAQPAYKSPLDVYVDKEGKTARVSLTGTRTEAVVDLTTGKLDEENIPGEDGMPHEARRIRNLRSLHFEEQTELIEWSNSTLQLEVAGYTVPRVAERNVFAGACWHKDHLLVVHQRPKFNIPATQVAHGWVFTNVLTLFPDMRQRLLQRMSKGENVLTADYPAVSAALDEPQQGYANPTDVVATPSGYAFVACSGADTVLVIDLKAFRKYAGPLKRVDSSRDQGSQQKEWRSGGPSLVLDGPDDLTASRHFIKAKLPTQANPRRLGLSGDGKTLVVSNYLGDSLTVIDTEKLKVVKHISLGGPPPDAARRGEILFNSGKMTFQGAFTCASCHPNGGTDGLNWDLTRDGVGNFKNTKSLLGVRDTAPYGWEGKSATLEDRVTGTLRTLHQHEPTGTEIADLVAYLKSLPPPKPVGEGDETIARGKELFQGKARCATCHKRAGYDDGKSHDVGTRGPSDTTDQFDTPSLLGVARTAPYLHDGRAATLEEIFTKHNPEKRHGAAHLLSEQELDDLIWFLKSL
jgi:cytochrome c